MSTLSQAAARVLIPLALGLFAFSGGAAAGDEKVEELKDYCGEINQIVVDSRTWLDADHDTERFEKQKTECKKLVFALTDMALKDTVKSGVAWRTLKELAKALKELREIASAEKVAEKVVEKSAEKLKEELKKKLGEALEGKPTVYTYKREGELFKKGLVFTDAKCSYELNVTWNLLKESFEIKISGDCKCNEVKVNVAGQSITRKIGKWESTIKGAAKINEKNGVGELTLGLDVKPSFYLGTGECDCDKPKNAKGKISLPVEESNNISLPPTETIAISTTVIRIHDREHRKHRHEHRKDDKHERVKKPPHRERLARPNRPALNRMAARAPRAQRPIGGMNPMRGMNRAGFGGMAMSRPGFGGMAMGRRR
jgi:hypothetical protein